MSQIKVVIGKPEETIPCHDGTASGTITIPITVSNVSHTDQAITVLAEVEGDLAISGGFLGAVKEVLSVEHVVAALKKL